MSNPLDFLKGTEAEVKAAEPIVEEVKPKAKAKAKVVEPEPLVDEVDADEPAAEVNPFDLADYQECRVSHKMKPRINPETLDKEWHPEFEVEKKLRITSIQHNQAELLNSQSANSNLRYYRIKK